MIDLGFFVVVLILIFEGSELIVEVGYGEWLR